MRKLALCLLVVALAAAAAPQVSSFYDPAADDWITYAAAADGYVYRITSDSIRDLGPIPGPGPHDLSAFYDVDYDDYIIYGIDADGAIYRYYQGEIYNLATLP